MPPNSAAAGFLPIVPTSPGELPNLAALFTEPLDRARLPYMVVGGVASISYGMPRTTEDVDICRGLEVQWRECQPPPGV